MSKMPSERFRGTSISDSEEVSTKEVLNILGFRKEDHDEQYRRHISAVGTPSTNTQERVSTSIVCSSKYRDWHSAPASAVLMICSGGIDLDTESILFLWSRNLVTHMKDKEEARRRMCIYYFCWSPGDKTEGTPELMMTSLVGQLLCQHESWGGDLQYVHYDLAKLKDHDLKTLCSTFEMLVKRLPATVTLHCVIDNISAFEKPAWQADMITVISRLAQLADNAVYKLLLTHANSSQYEEEYYLYRKSSVLFLEEIMSDDSD